MTLLGALSSIIAEVVVSKSVDFLIKKMVSFPFGFLKFPHDDKIQRGLSDDQIQQGLEKLKKELMMIRPLLDKAEERQLKDHCVKSLLSEIQNWVCDVDDIMDELETEAFRRNLMEREAGSGKRRGLNISDPLLDARWKSDMMSKIEDAAAKFKYLEPQINQLQLRVIGSQKSNVEPVYGRVAETQAICKLVKSEDEGNFVISIVGMRGIGKTTLAQLVYNDASIQNHFHHRAWVCVSDSDDFDVTRITKDIYRSVFPNISCDGKDLSSLQEELKEEFSKKKFLIVLDDVWNEYCHNWTILRAPFLARTPGSKIIVTTRFLVVPSTMGASCTYFLSMLSGDDSLSLLAHHALGARDFGGHLDLKEVAEKLVRQCNGLPLAVKTLGRLLCTNVNHDAWSEIWKLSNEREGIIPILYMSYYDLPPYLKRCFAYCSILPKDYEFEEMEIILLWSAEGFLQEAKEKSSIKDIGHKYFRDLLSRSLLQKSNKNKSRFVMHDLIHDLAQSVAGETCFRIMGDEKLSKHTQHLSYIAGIYDGIEKFEGIREAQHLRTFLPFWLGDDSFGCLTNDVLMHLLPNLRCLRVLSLKRYRIKEVPDFIGDLKHLRYLNFSYTLIKYLPESISTLYHLETLLLKGCWKLKKLPSNMENLVNLCFLDITGTKKLEGKPCNLTTLSDLQTLSNFVLQDGDGCQINTVADADSDNEATGVGAQSNVPTSAATQAAASNVELIRFVQNELQQAKHQQQIIDQRVQYFQTLLNCLAGTPTLAPSSASPIVPIDQSQVGISSAPPRVDSIVPTSVGPSTFSDPVLLGDTTATTSHPASN